MIAGPASAYLAVLFLFLAGAERFPWPKIASASPALLPALRLGGWVFLGGSFHAWVEVFGWQLGIIYGLGCLALAGYAVAIGMAFAPRLVLKVSVGTIALLMSAGAASL